MAKKYSTFDKGDEMKVHIASIHNDKNSSNVKFLNPNFKKRGVPAFDRAWQ